MPMKIGCLHCYGKGEVNYYDDDLCPTPEECTSCGGTGYIKVYIQSEIDEARKEERGRCAIVCEQISDKYWKIFKNNLNGNNFTYTDGVADAADLCADEIRNMEDL